MICTRPIHGARDAEGKVYPGLHPGLAPDQKAKVRCGKCPSCTLERASDWATRLSHELVTSRSAAFLTLTYDDDALPKDGSLVVDDVKNFCKRLLHDTGPFVGTALVSTAG